MKLWKPISKYEPELLLTIPFHFILVLGKWVKRLTRKGDPALCQPGWWTLRASDEIELKSDEINEI